MRRALALGAVAGLTAGAVMLVATLLLRLAAGIPLPTELVSDRLLPNVPVGTFLGLLNRLGGAIQAKQIGYFSAFLGQFGTAVVLGAIHGALAERARLHPDARGRLAVLARHPTAAVGALLTAMLLVLLAVLWPELDASYRGLPLGAARLATIVALAASFAIFLAVLELSHRVLTRARPQAVREPAGEALPRRAFLVGAAGVVAGAGSLGLMRRLYDRGAFGYDGLSLRPADLSEVTPVEKFYTVTKNLIDPRVDAARWRLEVTGHVEEPRTYTLADLQSMQPVPQVQTLECISNSVGGGLISNAEWTGVRLADLIAASRPREGAVQVYFDAVDGFTNAMSMERAMRPIALIALTMNGDPLQDRHGFPARLLAPGSYGEVSVKWITRIEVRTEEGEGYYARQGWKADHVETSSRFFDIRNGTRIGAPGRTTLRGVAFAGDRGISRVEVSLDGGRTWNRAALDYNPSPIAWTLWSLPWRATAGDHVLVVRAVDGEGTPQTTETRSIDPSGSAGLHRVTVTVA